MSQLKKFIEKQNKLSRFQILKSLFTSVAMTVTVVVVAVMVIPTSPKGEIIDIDRFTNSIVYTVQVTDSDSAIIEDTLKIRLENQSEQYERSISVGDSTGYFDNLSADTQYTIKILADKGFGLEVLDSEKFYTEENTGGAITEVSLQDSMDYVISYNIGYFISDPFDEFTSIQLRYGYKFPEEDEVTNFVTMPLSKFDQSVLIENIYNNNLEVHVYLKAFNQQGEMIELDYLLFYTPFQVYGSFYIAQVDSKQIAVSLYPDMSEGVDMQYVLVLKRNVQEIARKTVVFESSETQFHQEDAHIIFDKLKPNVEYTILLYGIYDNPYTLVETEELLYSETILTLSDFSSSIVLEEFDEYYEAHITLVDPENQFDVAYFSVYEITDFGREYLNYGVFYYDLVDDEKHFVVFVDKPLVDRFYIEIGVRSNAIYYNYSILKEIENIGGTE